MTPRARASASTPRRLARTTSASSAPLQLERERPAVDPRQLEQVVDERGQRRDLLVQGGEVVVRLGEPVVDRLEHRLHVRERRAQVVARPRDELAARLEQPLQARGHLVERLGERAVLARPRLGHPLREVAREPPGRHHDRVARPRSTAPARGPRPPLGAAPAATMSTVSSCDDSNMATPATTTAASGTAVASSASPISCSRTVPSRRSANAPTMPTTSAPAATSSANPITARTGSPRPTPSAGSGAPRGSPRSSRAAAGCGR